MDGLVCLRGTRIPADQLAECIYEMREDYGVTLEQLISLYHWDAAGRPELI